LTKTLAALAKLQKKPQAMSPAAPINNRPVHHC
jgi:hypothetical protein